MLIPPVVGGKIHSKTSDYDCFVELCRETTNVVFNQYSTCGPARFFSLRAVSGIKFTAVFTRKWIRIMWCHGFGTAVVLLENKTELKKTYPSCWRLVAFILICATSDKTPSVCSVSCSGNLSMMSPLYYLIIIFQYLDVNSKTGGASFQLLCSDCFH